MIEVSVHRYDGIQAASAIVIESEPPQRRADARGFGRDFAGRDPAQRWSREEPVSEDCRLSVVEEQAGDAEESDAEIPCRGWNIEPSGVVAQVRTPKLHAHDGTLLR